MRIKSYTLALALSVVVSVSSAHAATREKAEPGINRGPQEPNVIVRVVEAIKRRLAHIAGDTIIVTPPVDHP